MLGNGHNKGIDPKSIRTGILSDTNKGLVYTWLDTEFNIDQALNSAHTLFKVLREIRKEQRNYQEINLLRMHNQA